jgi:flagellar hook protein FlgE
MGIVNAMYSGVSGLSAEGDALGVVGDNVSNSNTIGFKQSRAVFEDILASAVGAPNAAGAGVRMARIQQIFAQGTLLNTGQATDLALSGDGFFVVNGTLDGITGNFYTRAGQTTLRNDGTLINSSGFALQGYAAQPGGTFSAQLGPIQVPTAALSPRATTEISLTANLDASAQVPAAAWDPQNPAATSNYSTSIRVYDSLGNAHTVDVYFRKTGANTWEYHALTPGADIQGGTPGQNVEIASGGLTFNTAGALQAVNVTTAGSASFVNATPNQAIAFDFGTPIASGGTGLGGATQFGAPSNVSSQSQDGYSSGDLSGVKIESDGTVKGIYSNGEQLAVGKLAIAKFRSNDGLGRAGHNLWTATRESGEPAIAEAGAGGRGAIVAGALEQSNVDIAQQFVELIAHQRAFQANSKTITTANEMLQEVVNLKR